MTIDIEKLAKEAGVVKSPFPVDYPYQFNLPELQRFAEAYAAKVLEDKEREVAELKAKIKHETSRKHINELQSHINDLREAINTALSCVDEEINPRNYNGEILTKFINDYGEMVDILQEALSKTPAQSLQALENEVIDRCENECDEYYVHRVGNTIRALKVNND